MTDDRSTGLSRRGFLKLLGGSATCLGAGACLPHVDGDWSSCVEGEPDTDLTPRSARVVEIFSPEAVVTSGSRMEIHGATVTEMFRVGLEALTETESMSAAWQQVMPGFQPGERVGLKVNALNKDVPTSPELIEVVTASLLQDLGLSAENAFIWDRTERELKQAGIVSERMGVTCCGTYVSSDDRSGEGYEEEPCCLSGRKIHLSRLLTRQTDHLINMAVMKNHFAAGFTGCLKNHYGSFDIPWEFHDDCERHIARLNAMREVAGNTRLLVMDALIGVCLADTNRPPDCTPKRLLLSFDPVAIDQRGLEIRDEMRADQGVDPGPTAGHLQQAEDLGLGTTDYQLVRIDL